MVVDTDTSISATRRSRARRRAQQVAVSAALFAGLFAASRWDYLVFHCVAEGFAVVVAYAVFLMVWSARKILQNDYFLFLGASYALVAGVEFLHMLAFRGMGVFDGGGPNMAAQLWLVARGVEASALLLAPLLVGRRGWLWSAFAALAVGVVALTCGAFAGWLPTAYIPGQGLTPLKVGVEYVFCALLLLAAWALYRRRALVNPHSARLMMAATALTIGGELALTVYVDVDGHANAVGHLLMLASFFCVYKAIIEQGLMRPYATLFLALQQRGVQLSASRDMLADLVGERTQALEAANARLRDEIAERQHAERRLLFAQKMEAIGRLAGGVAHDFNNFLTVIASHAHALRAALPPGDDHDAAQEIIEAGERAARLTRQLLSLSRSGGDGFTLRPTDLHAIIEGLRPTLTTLTGAAVTLTLDLDPRAGLAMLDTSPAEQILINLAINAKDAMPTGGALTVTLRAEVADAARGDGLPPGHYVHLAVRDTGCGMSPEVLGRVFEPFFTTKGDKGTGLGLPTVYGIVQRTGGHVHVESAPNAGTTFHIYLPRLPPLSLP